MSDKATSWRTVPDDPDLLAAAAANPGGSVAEIDADLVGGDPDGYVPPEAIHGCWVVGPDGRLTGEYIENPNHGVPKDDFSKLTEVDHFWGWLPAEPAVVVRDSVASLLADQVPGAALEWMKVTGTPEVLTGARRVAENEERLILVRAGVAVPFALSVLGPAGRDILWGVFTWAASGLDQPAALRRDRVWLDLALAIGVAKERLAERIYEVEQS